METPQAQNFTPLTALDAVVLDTETTGLDASRDRLVQIGALALRGAELRRDERFETLVDPGVPIPPESTSIHGISEEDLAGAPAPGEVVAALTGFIAERVVIGYAIGFDLAVLEREAAMAGQDWPELRRLDIRPLALAVAPPLAGYDLDALCAWAGVDNAGRHTAMGDAVATAELFAHLLPLLREKNIRTLAEAEAVCQSVHAREAKQRGVPADAAGENGASDKLRHLDAYAYETPVSAVMSGPPEVVSGALQVSEAVDLLIEKRISSVFVEDPGEDLGIVTERDLLRAISAGGEAAFQQTLSGIKSTPLQCVLADDLIYRAIGRLDRLGVRHLGVRDRSGALVGAVTTRNLLRHRTSAAMALGDEIDAAAGEADLGAAWSKVPAVARSLMDQGVGVDDISNVISAEICALTGRAAALGEARLMAEDKGPPPYPYALLVLGSAGRGESLISADQDNAIVIGGAQVTPEDDAWYARLGEHIADILDGVGIVYCKGGVMAKNEAWRHSEGEWQARIADWVTRQTPEDLLNVDIFFDAVAVHGEERLGRRVWEHGYALGAESRSFLRALEGTLANWRPPLGLLGGFQTGTDGRVDLKIGGLFPIVATARILSIKMKMPARGTAERLRKVAAADKISASAAESFVQALRRIRSAILRQQLLDVEQGRNPGSRVDPGLLDKAERRALRDAVKQASDAIQLVREGMF